MATILPKKIIKYILLIIIILITLIFINKNYLIKESKISDYSNNLNEENTKIKEYKSIIKNNNMQNNFLYLSNILTFLYQKDPKSAEEMINHLWSKYKYNKYILFPILSFYYKNGTVDFIYKNKELYSLIYCVDYQAFGDCSKIKDEPLLLDVKDPNFIELLNLLDDETYPDYYQAINDSKDFPRKTFLLDIKNNNKRALYWLNRNYIEKSINVVDLYNIVYLYAKYGNDKNLLNDVLSNLWKNYNSCELNNLKKDLEILNNKEITIPNIKINDCENEKVNNFNNLKKDINLLKMLDELKNQKITLD